MAGRGFDRTSGGLACWSCSQRFRPKLVRRDAILRGRRPELGGPYHLYRCPRCHQESMVETTPKGRMFASPERDISTVEYLFSWVELLNPRDFLRLAEWHRTQGARRRHFFEQDGDRRYSRKGIRGIFRRLFTPRPTERAVSSEDRKARSAPANRRLGVPHPYRILGVGPDASEREIRRAFQRLARKWHPDKQESGDPQVLEEAARRLTELLKAYETLQEKEGS